MARLNVGIDLDETERSAGGGGSFDVMPFGDYVLELTTITQKEVAGGTAHEYIYEVVEPQEFAKRRIWDTMMLDHPTNSKWVYASKGRIAKLCDAVGFDAEKEGELDPADGKHKLVDDDALLYRSFLAKVVAREGNAKDDGTQYDPKNEVADFYNPESDTCPAGPCIYEKQPPLLPAIKKKASPANDNRPAATSRPATPAARPAATGNRPWGQKRA